MSEGFLMDAKTAMIFYRCCHMFHIVAYEDRMELLRRLVAKRKVRYIRDAKLFLKGKNIQKYE